MISMYAEYSGRTLYVALSTDTIEGAKNGDTLYEMDTGKRYVYNESNDAWDEQPEEGGGGGYTVADVTFLNHKKSSNSSNFIIAVGNLDGVFPTSNKVLRTDTPYPITNMVIQNGFFAMRNAFPATRVV